jgi:hypothetical protein
MIVVPTPTSIFPTSYFVTPTPIPVADDRYGVIASGDGLAWQLEQLGVKWFIDYKPDPRGAPPGTKRVPYIKVKQGTTRIAADLVTEYAASVPGSAWYIGGETNVPAQDGISESAYVVEFDYYEQLIRAADPTAVILGPSVLNWDFTCVGCGGYQSGHDWMQNFVTAYAIAHGGDSPPIDAWALDAYPLTWSASAEYPNPLPMTEWELVTEQIVGMRDFLESDVPGHADTPIWVTEVASHWAYDSLGWDGANIGIPDTPYRWDLMDEYVGNLAEWLNSNGDLYKIDRWFFYRGYIEIANHAKFGYAGIYLFETGDTGAALTPTGEVYRDFAKGIRK